jgi:hypothetical protein
MRALTQKNSPMYGETEKGCSIVVTLAERVSSVHKGSYFLSLSPVSYAAVPAEEIAPLLFEERAFVSEPLGPGNLGRSRASFWEGTKSEYFVEGLAGRLLMSMVITYMVFCIDSMRLFEGSALFTFGEMQ